MRNWLWILLVIAYVVAMGTSAQVAAARVRRRPDLLRLAQGSLLLRMAGISSLAIAVAAGVARQGVLAGTLGIIGIALVAGTEVAWRRRALAEVRPRAASSRSRSGSRNP